MKQPYFYLVQVGTGFLVATSAIASTSYGDLNNFDTVNDTGQDCHGFEIEIDDVHKTDITYTYDWNHYSTPVISEDNSNPLHPKVFVRYQSLKNADGSWAAYTAVPTTPITPTNGHMCTNPAVNQGCEHFGVGFYGQPSAIKYNWLVDDGNGNLVHGPAVNVASPSWIAYKAPNVVAKPGDAVAQVVAVIPAPVEPIPPAKKFGEASWVKIIKTKTHNNKNLPLKDLVGDDKDGDGKADWTNGEPDEVETEWRLLQANSDNNAKKAALKGKAEALPNKNETVTRRYEFYKYVAGDNSIDGETGEAMCDAVATDGIHGDPSMNNVGVTNANGDTVYFDCSAVAVVGEYTGAQMAGFDPAAALGLIDNLQDADTTQAYSRRVVIGGSSPYTIQVTDGALPSGMRFKADTVDPSKSSGILEGTPTAGGDYSFNLTVTDALGALISSPVPYNLHVVGPQQPNRAPQANADNVRTYPKTAITVNVLANDTDVDGDALTIEKISRPTNGTAVINANGVIYKPKATFTGVDTFTYSITDGRGGNATGTVTVKVAPNQLPVAVADTVATTKNTPVTVNVLANDTDADGDALTLLAATTPLHGTLKKNADNTVTFTPAKNFLGVGGFTYKNTDGHTGGISSSTVTVNVGK